MSMHNGFLVFDRQDSEYRDIQERIQDWKEICADKNYSNIELKTKISVQATRCMDCGVPFCQSDVTKATGCPVENLIPDWNRLISLNELTSQSTNEFQKSTTELKASNDELKKSKNDFKKSELKSNDEFFKDNNWKKALDLLHLTNNFPEFTGKLCPAPCESACILGINEKPVSIRSIESALVEYGFEKGWISAMNTHDLRQTRIKEGRSLKVAIVGSGPAGLAAAQQLVRRGHQVTVFEKQALPGGLLRYGIPNFKLEKHFIDRRLDQLIQEGVTFRCNLELGKDFTLNELKNKFDKVALTIGAEKPRDLNIRNRHLNGIYYAMDFLTDTSGILSAKGKNVIIIGGGDTGADVLSTAIRQKAKSIRQLEIQSQPKNFKKSQAILEAEKIYPFWQVDFNCQTLEFISEKSDNGSVTHIHIKKGLDCVKQEIWPADLVILAVGFTGVKTEDSATEKLGLAKNNIDWMHLLNEKGVLQTSSNYQTKDPQVYAAGDSRRGASLIVWAIHEGRQMAEAICS